MTFQCEEGLIPSHPIITCTRIGRGGQWTPDPASVQCVPNIAEGKEQEELDGTRVTLCVQAHRGCVIVVLPEVLFISYL